MRICIVFIWLFCITCVCHAGMEEQIAELTDKVVQMQIDLAAIKADSAMIKSMVNPRIEKIDKVCTEFDAHIKEVTRMELRKNRSTGTLIGIMSVIFVFFQIVTTLGFDIYRRKYNGGSDRASKD